MKNKIIILIALIFILFSPVYVNAQEPDPPPSTVTASNKEFDNPIVEFRGQSINANTIIGNLIKILLGIVGSIALALFIYSGFNWMTAQGNPEKIKNSQQTMLWAAIGLLVIFGSYTVLNFVIDAAQYSTAPEAYDPGIRYNYETLGACYHELEYGGVCDQTTKENCPFHYTWVANTPCELTPVGSSGFKF